MKGLTDDFAGGAARVNEPLSCAELWGESAADEGVQNPVATVRHHRGVTSQLVSLQGWEEQQAQAQSQRINRNDLNVRDEIPKKISLEKCTFWCQERILEMILSVFTSLFVLSHYSFSSPHILFSSFPSLWILMAITLLSTSGFNTSLSNSWTSHIYTL